jgi:hypothetical protein
MRTKALLQAVSGDSLSGNRPNRFTGINLLRFSRRFQTNLRKTCLMPISIQFGSDGKPNTTTFFKRRLYGKYLVKLFILSKIEMDPNLASRRMDNRHRHNNRIHRLQWSLFGSLVFDRPFYYSRVSSRGDLYPFNSNTTEPTKRRQ